MQLVSQQGLKQDVSWQEALGLEVSNPFGFFEHKRLKHILAN